MTFTAGQVLTASQLNTHLRDNMMETEPAKAVTVGGYMVGTGPFGIAERNLATARISSSETTTEAAYGDLGTVGPNVTVTTGTSAWVQIYCASSNNTADRANLMSYAITGATTQDGMDARSTMSRVTTTGAAQRLTFIDFLTGLTPGENVFTAKYRTTQNTATFSDRYIGVFPL